jgi:Salmonella virulence plasmid 65kDa B protein/Insecticide toxin TcdB middle/N-terminal region
MIQGNWTRRPSAPQRSARGSSPHRSLTRLSAITGLLLLATSTLQAQTATIVAGTPPGQFGVSSGGSASYTIPISVPPGVAGMQPSLALSYNSQGGSGLVGMGWNLGGLSSITRCPRTKGQDGVRGSVNFDDNDRYCLDGQRLILSSGTYGQANAEYRTEMEGFSKIVSLSRAGNGAASFKVWTKGGQIMEYGNTADSRIEAVPATGTTPTWPNTTVRVWALNKITDVKGNYLTVSYTEDATNGVYRPARIDYAGNATAGTPTHSSVRFTYVALANPVPKFQAGAIVKLVSTLSDVSVYHGASTLVSKTKLTYQSTGATQTPRLSSVQQCDGATLCLAALNVSYVAPGVGFAGAATGWLLPGVQYQNQSASGVGGTINRLVDLNGDGLPDLYVTNPGNSSMRGVVYFNTGTGFSSTATNWLLPGVQYQNQSDSGGGTINQLVDLNGDGLPDLYVTNPGNSSMRGVVYFNTGTGFSSTATVSSAAGPTTAITYARLTDPVVYTKDSGANAAVFPQVDLARAASVVASVASSNGIGGTNTTSYSYGGLKFEAGTGRGMLGFRWVKSKDLNTGLERYTEYRQDFPYTGMPAKSETRLAGSGNAGVLKRSTTTPACNIPQTGVACTVAPDKTYFPFVSSQLDEAWDLNGSAYPSSTSTVSYTAFPHYGGPTQTSISSTEGWSKTTANEYLAPDTANWIVGRVKKTTVTSVKP